MTDDESAQLSVDFARHVVTTQIVPLVERNLEILHAVTPHGGSHMTFLTCLANVFVSIAFQQVRQMAAPGCHAEMLANLKKILVEHIDEIDAVHRQQANG